jgi:hypothetical protein
VTRPRQEPWHRQPGETVKEYEKFRAFLDSGSVRGSYRAVTGKEKDAPGSWYELAERRGWSDRALAKEVSESRKMEAALRARRLKSLEAVADLGETLRKKASAAARLLVGVTQRVGEIEGREAVIIEVNMSPSDICALAKTGAALESLALGLPTDRTSQQDGGSDEVVISVEAAKEEMRKRLAEIRERQQKADAITDLLRGT